MTKEDFRSDLNTLGLSHSTAAEFLGRSVRQISSYANGTPIPLAIEKLLRVMVAHGLKPSDVK